MYGIIFWLSGVRVYPVMTEDGEMKQFETLPEADTYANRIEEGLVHLSNFSPDSNESIECEVISLDKAVEQVEME